MNTDGYNELTSTIGKKLDVVVKELMKLGARGEKWFVSFNGVLLYSDSTTMESAYLEVVGMTKDELDEKHRKGYHF